MTSVDRFEKVETYIAMFQDMAVREYRTLRKLGMDWSSAKTHAATALARKCGCTIDAARAKLDYMLSREHSLTAGVL